MPRSGVWILPYFVNKQQMQEMAGRKESMYAPGMWNVEGVGRREAMPYGWCRTNLCAALKLDNIVTFALDPQKSEIILKFGVGVCQAWNAMLNSYTGHISWERGMTGKVGRITQQKPLQ